MQRAQHDVLPANAIYATPLSIVNAIYTTLLSTQLCYLCNAIYLIMISDIQIQRLFKDRQQQNHVPPYPNRHKPASLELACC